MRSRVNSYQVHVPFRITRTCSTDRWMGWKWASPHSLPLVPFQYGTCIQVKRQVISSGVDNGQQFRARVSSSLCVCDHHRSGSRLNQTLTLANNTGKQQQQHLISSHTHERETLGDSQQELESREYQVISHVTVTLLLGHQYFFLFVAHPLYLSVCLSLSD